MSYNYPNLADKPTYTDQMSDRQPLTATSNFGESEFGQRMEYTAPVYRDIVFGIAYYIQLFIVLGFGVYLWVMKYPDIIDTDTGANDWHSEISLTGIFVGIAACLIGGILFGLFWLAIMIRFASCIIKAMLFLNIAVWILIALVGLFVNAIMLTIIGVIFALIYILYTWCVWSRIPFSSALLSVSSSITSKYGGTIFISLCVIIFDILWIAIWGSCASAYLVAIDEEPNNGVIFVLLISLYWGFQVNQNISHCTSCGVTASWYFSKQIDYNPTPRAFKRTMTTSFGSVCLGSLIVAILQAIREMVRMCMMQSDNECITCIVLCILSCIEAMIEYFNKYAYAQCAIYGVSFVTAAKRTWGLFKSRGIDALINDDLTGLAIFGGAIIGAVVSAAIGWFIGYLFYNDSDDRDIRIYVPIGLAIFGFIIGLILTSTILYVVHSSIICLFVCYSEDPATLHQNRPQQYDRIVATKPEFEQIFINYGGEPSVSQQNRPPPYAQQAAYNQQQQQNPNMYGNRI